LCAVSSPSRDLKPIVLCEPSQKGLSFDAPQRHSETLLPASMTWPRIETASTLTTLVSGKPLEWSARQAYRELLEWVVEDYEIARPQAALLLAMVARAGICQISNTDYTAYCAAPRDVLEPYRG